MDALLGELPLVAGHAVVAGVLLDKVPGAEGLLAALAGEAVLVPAGALVLHLLGACLQQRQKHLRLSNQITALTVSFVPLDVSVSCIQLQLTAASRFQVKSSRMSRLPAWDTPSPPGPLCPYLA